MDKRINYKIILDCETCPLDKDYNGISPKNMFVYDIGWAIVDKRGKVYAQKSYAIADIFIEEKELMRSAYYVDKIPQYWAEIKNGERELKTFYNIKKEFLKDIEEWQVTEIYAHNMYFDYIALTNTQRWLTKSKNRYFFPKNIKIMDTLKMARQVIAKMPTYIKFCNENNYLTKRGQVQLKAETIYRFLTKNNNFEEAHKGINDVMIEKEILAYCYRQHKKMNGELWNHFSGSIAPGRKISKKVLTNSN